MELRVVSRMGPLRRRYYLYKKMGRVRVKWVSVGSSFGYDTEKLAKEYAEDYAKGTWVSDSAIFPPK